MYNKQPFCRSDSKRRRNPPHNQYKPHKFNNPPQLSPDNTVQGIQPQPAEHMVVQAERYDNGNKVRQQILLSHKHHRSTVRSTRRTQHLPQQIEHIQRAGNRQRHVRLRRDH